MKLLLAIDVHDHTDSVFEQARQWAMRLDGTLDLLYVNTFGSYLPYIHSPNISEELNEELERIREQETSQLNALLDHLPAAHRGQVHLMMGDPAASVLELCAGYDLLLIATHGRTGLSHLWMGSVAEQIVRRAPIPALVLRIESGG
jgi:nucleotide-binding universal stress UspA family protein